MNDLTGLVALITGATSGIGAATAKRFAQAGATVICTGRNIERGEAIVQNIVSNGGKASFYAMDIMDDNSISNVSEKVAKEYGKLNILFNNAGIFPMPVSIEQITRKDIGDVIKPNLEGLIMTIRYFLPIIEGGVVINCSSMSGLDSYVNGQNYAYDSSKASIIKITKLLAKKYGSNIRFNVICPGVIKTPIWLNFDEERHRQSIPVGRVGCPEDIASVANFLASKDAEFINGAVIVVDGGQSL